MKNDAILKNEESAIISDQAFKATALLYLREALEKQEFESCEELIEIAKKFGAQQGDINAVIAAYIRGDENGVQNEATPGKNRLANLKEGK